MKPTRLLDPNFPYVPAAATDIRKTFARVRKEQKKTEQKKQEQIAEDRHYDSRYSYQKNPTCKHGTDTYINDCMECEKENLQ